MMRLANLDDGDVFLDMGSGTGKACVAAGLLYPNLAVCRGVELLDGLHREAEVRSLIFSILRALSVREKIATLFTTPCTRTEVE